MNALLYNKSKVTRLLILFFSLIVKNVQNIQQQLSLIFQLEYQCLVYLYS